MRELSVKSGLFVGTNIYTIMFYRRFVIMKNICCGYLA